MHRQFNFDSLSEWTEYSHADRATDDPASHRRSCQAQKGFAGVSTKEEAYTLLRKGWPEGLARMRSVLAALQNGIQLPTMHDHFENAVSGCAPNVEAYIQGIPEDMFVISQIEADAPPSILTVQFELAYNASITIEQANLGGAVVFAAMEALRMQGCAVTALMTHTVKNRHTDSTWQASCPIPNNLDLDTLSFVFSHPAMLRVLMFSIMEHEPAHIRAEYEFDISGGYSFAHNLRHPSADQMITMNQICQHTYTMEQAQRVFQKLVESKFKSVN